MIWNDLQFHKKTLSILISWQPTPFPSLVDYFTRFKVTRGFLVATLQIRIQLELVANTFIASSVFQFIVALHSAYWLQAFYVFSRRLFHLVAYMYILITHLLNFVSIMLFTKIPFLKLLGCLLKITSLFNFYMPVCMHAGDKIINWQKFYYWSFRKWNNRR